MVSLVYGRAIINIEDQDIQTDIYSKIVSQNLSVHDTEALVKLPGSLKPNLPETQKQLRLKSLMHKSTFTNYF
jgi:ParB family chromosome partitioning protein